MQRNDLLWRYAQHQQRRGLSRNTIASRSVVLWGLATFLDPDSLLAAERRHIEAWLDSHHLEARARYTYISHAHCFYVFAIREGLTDRDPTERIDRPKLPRRVPRPIAPDDLHVALDTAEPRVRAMIALAAFGGLRCQEIAGLHRDHILDHEDPPLILVVAGKGGRERVVPLATYAEHALRSYGMPRSGPLFPRPDGRHLAPYTVSQLINQHLHGLGIASTAHTLRHSFASTVYRATADLRMVQELLGHASPSTTAIYAAWSPLKAARVVRGLEPQERSGPVGPERDVHLGAWEDPRSGTTTLERQEPPAEAGGASCLHLERVAGP